MSAKAIYEAKGKELLNKFLGDVAIRNRFVSIDENVSWNNIRLDNPWLTSEKLVVKPDQLIKRRGKLGLIKAGVDINGVQEWLSTKLGKDFEIGAAKGKLKTFIIEPFVEHSQNEEFYVCIHSHRYADTILFHHEGGIDIGDVDSKALKLDVPVDEKLLPNEVTSKLLTHVPNSAQKPLTDFIVSLYKVYQDLHFTYLEINPLVVKGSQIYILDLAAKIDQCAEFLCKAKWGNVDFPPPFGRDALPEEAYIAELDAKSGASLKLTILNRKGRIWTMVAGGGASVIYADTICDLGGASELANYGEYSGAPSEQQTYEYAKTVLSLMTEERHPDGKILIIGGGIANFTNVAATFKGIVRSLEEFQQRLVEGNVTIYVRRAGPNYQEGLRIMRELGNRLGLPIHVFGPETHMTAIVSMALGCRDIPTTPKALPTTANFLLPTSTNQGRQPSPTSSRRGSQDKLSAKTSLINAYSGQQNGVSSSAEDINLFTKDTECIVWGMQQRAVQGMLDFDYVCSRTKPSVIAMIYPFTGDHKQKFYWGHKEILIPVYKNMDDCMKRHPSADTLVNFASLRSAYESTIETLNYPQIRSISIIAEGIPENLTRHLIKVANHKKVTIIGPATVGGVKPGCFKIGNTGGMLDNILASKLYRPGSVAYVSRSGGMSNELNNIVALNADGVYEGIAIGGDRYPGSTFMDHILRYQANSDVKMIVLLGEVGGVEEYQLVEAMKNGTVNKPVIAWCIGTCAKMFTSEVQFGHAGSCANADIETANSKNEALRSAGATVPRSFDELGTTIQYS